MFVFLGDGEILKGNLINCASDNKGTHTFLGMFDSHNSHFYCQHCQMHRDLCRYSTYNDPQLRRSEEEYQQIFQDNGMVYGEVDDACGLKMYSLLNDVEDYLMFGQQTIDPVHDIAEGNIPDIVKKYVKKVITHGVKTLNEINQMIKVFDYGFIHHNNISR